MALVARLILHVKEFNSKRGQQGMGGAMTMGPGPHGHMGAAGPPGMGDGQVGVPDPMNALQNLARVGGQPPQQGMMASQAQQQQQQQQMMHQQQQQRQLAAQQAAMMRGQMARPTLQRQDAFIVTSQNVQQMPGPGIVSSANQMGFQQQPGVVNAMSAMGRPNQMVPMGPGPMQQFMQSVGPQGPMSVGSDIMSPNPQSSPAPGLPVPSPGSNLIPSPANRGMMGAPSPSGYLNTPGNAPSSVPSPGAISQSLEEKQYLEKLVMLSKYIEPLRRSVNNLEKNKDEDSKKNYTKMKNLLDILTDTSKRVSMQTLNRCEQALNNWHLNNAKSAARDSGFLGQSLYDAVAAHLASPMLNHTLQRTFGPAMSAFLGEGISVQGWAKKSKPLKGVGNKEKADKKMEEGLPLVLQREVANLGIRFRVSLDPLHHPGNLTIHLVCKLDDLNLPSVPPLLVTILPDYPASCPVCDPAVCPGYDASNFFRSVGKTLCEMLRRMSEYSLTSLLNAWEMSVRKACAPSLPVESNMLALVT